MPSRALRALGLSCPSGLFLTIFSTREIEREALERDRQIDALEFDSSGDLEGPGREVQDGFDSGRDHEIHDLLRRFGGNRDDGDADALLPHERFQVGDTMDGYAAARLLTDFGAQVVEERGNLEALSPKSRVIGERQAEVAGADDRDVQLAIEPQNLPQVALEVADVVADAELGLWCGGWDLNPRTPAG